MLAPTVGLALLASCARGPSPAALGARIGAASSAAPGAPPANAVTAAAPALAPLDVDPTRLDEMPVGRLCSESLARAEAILDEIRALASAPDEALTFENTLGKFDDATLAVQNASDLPWLMAVAHPDRAVRDEAKRCEPEADKFRTAVYLDRAVASVVKRFAARRPNLAGPRAHLLAFVLRNYRREGLDLDAAGQAKLRELSEAMSNVEQAFEANLAGATLAIEVKPDQLAGLPPAYVDAHKPDAAGDVRVTTDYPDYLPFMRYAKDRKAALELYKKFHNRAAERNVALLERLLALRHDKAKLLGYETWAHYALEPRMAKSPAAVATFLEGTRRHLLKRGADEMRELRAMHVKLGGAANAPIGPSDDSYLRDQVRRAKFGLDSKAVSEYFEVSRVLRGLLNVTSAMYGVTYREDAGAPTWHPDVVPMRVLDAQGALVGRLYFDLYPRPDKYKHVAVFGLRRSKTMADGARLVPITALVCNFPKPAPGAPALLSHGEVATFFHEFGHAMHQLLTRSEFATFAGLSVERDFVEAPSQMFEEWAWSREALDRFAKHYQTGAPLPRELFRAMAKARTFGRALDARHELFLAALDHAYHTREPGFDTTRVLAEVNRAYLPFPYVEGTHFQASFGQLAGLGGGYYGYPWSQAIAQDLLTRFAAEGLLNPKTAADYRDAVLAPGGTDDAAKLVERFLGRPTNDRAYKRYLDGALPAEAKRP